MTTIIIDEKSKKGKIVDGHMVSKPVKLNRITLKAVKNVYKGKTMKCDNFQDYLLKVV